MAVNSKQKGGAFERKIAKELSLWFFEDEDVLKRSPTSGADKCIWNGDIVPMKQLPDTWEKQFPFIIECKTGYEQFYPTFWNYNKIIEWFQKAYKESIDHDQHNVFLICQFKNRPALCITNIFIDLTVIYPNVIIPIHSEVLNCWLYVYDYKTLLTLNFNMIFQKE